MNETSKNYLDENMFAKFSFGSEVFLACMIIITVAFMICLGYFFSVVDHVHLVF